MVSRRRGVTAAEPARGRPPVVAAQLGEVTPSRASPQCPAASPPSLPGGLSPTALLVLSRRKCRVLWEALSCGHSQGQKEGGRSRAAKGVWRSIKQAGAEGAGPSAPVAQGPSLPVASRPEEEPPGGRPASGLRTGRARTACHTTGQGSQEGPPGCSDRVVSVGLGHRQEYDHSGSKHIKYVWFFFFLCELHIGTSKWLAHEQEFHFMEWNYSS